MFPVAAQVRDLIPLLFVQNLEQSVHFYCETLGFELAESWAPDGTLGWCRVKRGGASVMLQLACEEDGPPEGRGRGVGFYFLCDDANRLYEELDAKGFDVDPPRVAFYGMNQLYLRDPDGYELCFQNPTDEVP
jgi:glyoxylase I family protein